MFAAENTDGWYEEGERAAVSYRRVAITDSVLTFLDSSSVYFPKALHIAVSSYIYVV